MQNRTTRKRMLECLAMTALLAASGAAMAGGAMKVESLKCEYRSNPVGLDAARPRLGWIPVAARSSARGLRQSAYQVLVASEPGLLKAGRADLWDSGKVASGLTAQIEYAGKPLASEQACFWTVRVWDQDDQASDWSDPARWTMGLLQPSDWQAKWIGFDDNGTNEDPKARKLKELVTLKDSPWIWTGGAKAGDQPAGPAYFRKVVDIPAGRAVARAVFVIAADDGFNLYVNGHDAGAGHNWKNPKGVEVTGRLRPGRNAFAIKVTNGGDKPTPAGLMGRLVVLFDSGDPLVVSVDESWKSNRNESAGWKGDAFNEAGWTASSIIAKQGDAPWGELAVSLEAFSPAPYLRTSFTVAKPVKRAVLFASALGVYDLRVNGEGLGDVLSPGWTDYRKRVHYMGYDVTKRIRRGENAIGAILGDGWYAGYLAFTGRRHYYGDKTRFIARLRIDFTDGTSQVVATGPGWKAAHGAVRAGDLLMGCDYDARLEPAGWDRPGFDDGAWKAVSADDTVKAPLEAHPGEPMRRTQELKALSVAEPKPGVYVFDLGQNMVGWVRLSAKGEAGRKVTLRHAEMLNPDGTIYTANLRAAKATDTFLLAGGPARAYEPYFTFHGFRYVEVTGLDYRPAPRDVTGIVVHSDLPPSGSFECDHPLVNKLMENTVWGQRGNFLDVPTDCPQRDERAGWTGDAQVFMKAACLNLDSPAFFTKWLVDLCQDSQREDGALGDVAPHVSIVGHGNTGWGDAGLVCNWQMVQLYGDTRVVRRHYESIKKHMGYLDRTAKDFVRGTGAYGDWLRLAGPQHSDAIGTAYYFYAARLMSELSAAVGETADAERYRGLAESIRTAFVSKFVKEDGRIVDSKNETGQTFYALAFGLDLVPADRRDAVAKQFVAEIEKQKNHLATGFLGTPFVLVALQKAGRADLAYRMVLNEDYPSWLLQVKLGSTTMWERWDGWLPDKGFQDAGMNSFNHYWLGCVGEWLKCAAAGIDTDGPGFARIAIRPTLDPSGQGFKKVRAHYDSIRGRIESEWELEDGEFELETTIPANTTATIFVPAKDAASVEEGGRPAAKAKGLKFLRFENGCAVFEAGSGRYEFESAL